MKRLHGVGDHQLDRAVSARGKVEPVEVDNQMAVMGQGVVVGFFCKIMSRLPAAPKGSCRIAANPAQARDDWAYSMRWRLGL